ncbi:sporulation initiation factor Spo0A C-terminal domain-containing protein [uncultured Ruminococcus sp.]|uniref:sporulation initiation factor Spo0A C-terminal domain-containing protein n=1 Tax=uncultured Ruminococcus sp. TaxID=165186 RepID=UPI00262BCA35|nr:sporulation initiation factor Spo0A C-terminal domain-containing protein [uncultured Ruminococcus sp.]
MGKHLLICDSSAPLGRIIAQKTVNMGLSADCCRPAMQNIMRRCAAEDYQGILLFTFCSDSRLLDFVRQAAESGKAVFVGLYSPSAALRADFRRAGAARVFVMPCSVEDICRRIMSCLTLCADTAGSIEMFLEDMGLPRRLSGFRYLAKASELCMNEPERLWGGMSGIYEETAAEFSTSGSLVERALRNLGSQAAENGSLSRLTEGRLAEKPTNTELICAVLDMFSRL